jgi:hypothetical protein
MHSIYLAVRLTMLKSMNRELEKVEQEKKKKGKSD